MLEEPKTRAFELTLPSPDVATAPGDSPPPHRKLSIRVPEHLFVPRVLERDGLAAYEPETLACFLAATQLRGGPVFDVGANVGVFSWLAAALTDAEVVAFEPTPQLAAAARDLQGDNGLSYQVEEIALGAENGTATFYLSSLTDSSNSLLLGFRPSKASLEVPVETLDGYCQRTATIPAVLKVDTEATEPDVLRGGLETLRDHRPWIVCEVLARRTEADLEALLGPLGYQWYQITTELPLAPRREIFGDRSYRFKNWLFTPETPGDELWDAMRTWRQALATCTPPPKRKPRAAPVPPPPRAATALPQEGEVAREPASGGAPEGVGAPEASTGLPRPPSGAARKPVKRKGVYGRKKMLAGFLTGVCCGALATRLRRR